MRRAGIVSSVDNSRMKYLNGDVSAQRVNEVKAGQPLMPWSRRHHDACRAPRGNRRARWNPHLAPAESRLAAPVIPASWRRKKRFARQGRAVFR